MNALNERRRVGATTFVAVTTNPAEQQYVEAANRAFGDWGNSELFRRVYRREDGHGGQAFFATDGDQIVGGTGVVIRSIVANGRPGRVAFMVGSFVDPEARRTGRFADMVHFTQDVASEIGCDAIAAFAPTARSSTHVLQRQPGAIAASFSYCEADLHPPSTSSSLRLLEGSGPPDRSDVWSRSSDRWWFDYSDEQWHHHFRPDAPKTLALVDPDGRPVCFGTREESFVRISSRRHGVPLADILDGFAASGEPVVQMVTHNRDLPSDLPSSAITPGTLSVLPTGSGPSDLLNEIARTDLQLDGGDRI